jgi:hypothetical protein
MQCMQLGFGFFPFVACATVVGVLSQLYCEPTSARGGGFVKTPHAFLRGGGLESPRLREVAAL